MSNLKILNNMRTILRNKVKYLEGTITKTEKELQDTKNELIALDEAYQNLANNQKK